MGEDPTTQTPPADGGADEAPELSIVMPCLDEAETLGACLAEAQRFLDASGVAGELIVGDNGSADGSQAIARAHGARVVPVAERGYGAALYGATLAARGTYVIMGDSDGSYDFSALSAFLEKLRTGCDLVMGNRFAGGIQPGAMPWKNRFIGNPVLSRVGRMLFHSPAGDFHSGLRGYSMDAFRRMDLRTTGMEFASEMVIKATLMGMRIAEVPIVLRPDGRSRRPHLRPWRDGWRHLRFMLLYSPRWLFLIPGLISMLVGAALGAYLLPGPRQLGGATLDVHTLLFAAVAVLVGYQGVLFAVFAKIFAITTGLLPPDKRIDRLFRVFTLEVGLIVGAVFILAGLAGSIGAVFWWHRQSFGPLETSRVLRVVIPSAMALVLGCQTVMSSFFLSLLGMGRR